MRGLIMKYGISLTILYLLTAAQVSTATEWYVGPDGKAANPGMKEAPWDIASALNGKQKIAAGDTIYLLEGTYKRRPAELFEVRLVGTAENPIHVRALDGKRVRIDGGLSIQSPSENVWICDLEIFVSEPVPEKPVSPGSNPKDLKRPWGGLHMYGGKNCKYINLLIHYCNQGISCWKGEINPEIYGCIIYNNGWLGTDRGHGHCIYTQNDEGVKVISNCIMSCRYDGTYTMHAYGSERAYVNNYLVEDNICYNIGPFLIGGGRPSRNIRVFRNYLYNISMRIGYNAPYNENCELRDNIIVNGDLSIDRYQNVVQESNLVIKKGQTRPAGAKSIFLPNRYDKNRAHLAIYNWDVAEKVRVETGSFFKSGETFRLMNPQDLFGSPVMQGKCYENAIEIPTKSEFAVFVILKND
jgi:hypothetical protein